MYTESGSEVYLNIALNQAIIRKELKYLHGHEEYVHYVQDNIFFSLTTVCYCSIIKVMILFLWKSVTKSAPSVGTVK